MILAGPADDASRVFAIPGVSQRAAGGGEEPDVGRGAVHRQRQRSGAHRGGVRRSGGGAVRPVGSGDLGAVAHRSAVLTSRGGIDEIAVDEVMAAAEALRSEREGAGMSELGRLLRYSRPYTPHLIVSVVLMACVGAAQALTALLIGPIFDRVLNPGVGRRAGAAVHHSRLQAQAVSVRLDAGFDPQRLDHGGGRNPGGVLHQGPVRLLRQLSDQLRRLLRGHGSAPDGLRSRGASGRAFLRVQLDGARDVVDHERPGKDPGGAVADSGGLAAAELHGAGACWPWCCRPIGSWRWSA